MPLTANRWVLAARPPTLLAAVAPVLVGSATAWRDGVWAALAMLVILVSALAIQIGVNFANDLADAHKGADTEARIGPLRTVSSGLVSPSEMKLAIAAAFGVAGLGGIYLIWIAGWVIFAIGVVSIIAALGYTNGPVPYGYYGLGEVFVFIFFGLVATAGTRYVYDLTVTSEAWVGGVIMGLLAMAILEANNIRDVDTDSEARKRTIAVIIGRQRARALFAATLGVIPFIIMFSVLTGLLPPMCVITLVVAPLGIPLVQTVYRETSGPALISVLKGTAQLQMLTALMLSLGIVF
jgi:1,4-dihydroxy-2-naphthoate octaprenyltransferase